MHQFKGYDMKACGRCGEMKEYVHFHKNSAKKDGFQDTCKVCKSQISADAYKNLPHRKAAVTSSKKAHVATVRDYLNDVRSSGCLICGEREVCTLDFHHVNPAEKERAVTKMVTLSLANVKKEVAKCVVLCSNCHRKVHAGVSQLPSKQTLTE